MNALEIWVGIRDGRGVAMRIKNRALGGLARAFSLVEVAIAMGVFSFALVTIMGLLPVVLQTSRDSFDRAVAAQIATAVAGEFERKPFSELDSGSYAFDGTGERAEARAGAVYFADASVDASESGKLRRLKVEVRRGEAAKPFNTHAFLLFNND